MTAKKSLPSAGNIPKEKTQTGDLQHSRDKIDFFGDGWKLWRKFYSTDQFQIHSDLFFLLRTLHTCSLEPLLIDGNYNTFRWCMHALKVNLCFSLWSWYNINTCTRMCCEWKKIKQWYSRKQNPSIRGQEFFYQFILYFTDQLLPASWSS